jgi:hypothetical protein
MKRTSMIVGGLLVATALFLIPLATQAQDEPFKWYGIGGELNGPRRWFARIGVTQSMGAEVIFAMDYRSGGISELDVGVGAIYDYAPTSQVSPYVAGRFILHMEGNGESKTSGRVEAAGGVEYVIMERIGVSGEINFNFSTDPSRVMTTTLMKFYFYF